MHYEQCGIWIEKTNATRHMSFFTDYCFRAMQKLPHMASFLHIGTKMVVAKQEKMLYNPYI